MNSARSLVPSAILLALFSLTAIAAQELTVEEAIDIALRQNRDLLTLRLNLEAGGLNLQGANNEFKWTIFPDGSAGVSQDGTEAQAGLGARKKFTWGTQFETGARLNDRGDDIIDRRAGSVRVEIQQPLLKNSGRFVNMEAIRRAQSEIMSARRRLELQRADLVVRVVEFHQELVRLQNQIVSDDQSLKRSDQLYRLTRAREAQGRATRVDTLRTEFQRGRAELSLSATRERLQSVRKDLADLLAQPPDSELMAVPGPLMELNVIDHATAETIALSNRLDFADALQSLRDAQRGVRVARKNLEPRLDLVSRYERIGEGPSYSDAYHLDEDLWFVGLAADTDLYRRSEHLDYGQSQLDAAGAENQIATLESAIRRQVQQALLAYERAVQQVDFAARNYDLAKTRARLSRRLFEIGRSDNFTVTDAETELLQAESEMLRTKSDTNVAAYRVLRMLGTLIEAPDDLKPRWSERS